MTPGVRKLSNLMQKTIHHAAYKRKRKALNDFFDAFLLLRADVIVVNMLKRSFSVIKSVPVTDILDNDHCF